MYSQNSREGMNLICDALEGYVFEHLRTPQNLSMEDRKKREFLLSVIQFGRTQAASAPTQAELDQLVAEDQAVKDAQMPIILEAMESAEVVEEQSSPSAPTWDIVFPVEPVASPTPVPAPTPTPTLTPTPKGKTKSKK